MSDAVLTPAHRERPPRPRSITRRKQLAQEIRNELFAYKDRVADKPDHIADSRIRRVDAKFAELLILEGYVR